MKKVVIPIFASFFSFAFLFLQCDGTAIGMSFDGERAIENFSCCCRNDAAACSCPCGERKTASANSASAECKLYATGCDPSTGSTIIVGQRELSVPLRSIALDIPSLANMLHPLDALLLPTGFLDDIFQPPKFS